MWHALILEGNHKGHKWKGRDLQLKIDVALNDKRCEIKDEELNLDLCSLKPSVFDETKELQLWVPAFQLFFLYGEVDSGVGLVLLN